MLELVNINKSYKIDKKDFKVLKNLNLSFNEHEFCAILGPSGCGKTTLLNLIGGLDQYDDGDLIIDGVSTKTYKDKDWDNYRNKRIGFVFQNYNLIPHLTLLKNVEMALTLDGQPKKERIAKAKKALEVVGLGDMVNKRPNQLSGGQQQRVALARALINDPEIVLADEPTGALDTASSTQIMELLRDISQTRLVIMVTHNEDLAAKYSTRIVKMVDGKIVSDTSRLTAAFKTAPKTQKKKETALQIIDEKEHKHKKKNRTSMSFSTALGISLNNLMTKKGRTILTSIAGSFGIIGVALVLATSNGFTNYINRVESQTASTMPLNIPSYAVYYEPNPNAFKPEKHSDEELIYPVVSNLGKPQYRYNNFSPKYFNFLNKLRDEDQLLNDYIINYDENYSFNLMTNFFDGSINMVRNESTVGIADMITSYTGLPMQLFHVLYGEEKYIRETYDVIDGTYPQNYDEIVLVVDAYNRLPQNVLKALGFYDEDASEEDMIKNPITFTELYDKKIKVFDNGDFYVEQPAETLKDNLNYDRDIYQYHQKNYEESFNSNDEGIELKITGILRPNKQSTFTLMSSGLCYTTELQEKMVSTNKETPLYKNIVNNFAFNKTDSNGNAYTFLDFFNELMNLTKEPSVAVSTLNDVYNKYFTFYNYRNGKPYNVNQFLNDCRRLGVDLVSPTLKNEGINLGAITSVLIKVQTDILIPGKANEAYKELISLIALLNSYSEIQSIIVFPKDLSSKDKLIAALDEFNKLNPLDPKDEFHATNKGEQIFYMDFAGDFTKNLGQMINIISIVLVIFASISLCVSCVMTGIITYVSVIERTKEIGILRALGARKKDVGRLFQAESCIIGLLSGIFGCFAAWLICIPINLILNAVYPGYNIGNIASLSIFHTIILVVISVLLTFFSGLIPARVAAKKDPVIALRTE